LSGLEEVKTSQARLQTGRIFSALKGGNKAKIHFFYENKAEILTRLFRKESKILVQIWRIKPLDKKCTSATYVSVLTI